MEENVFAEPAKSDRTITNIRKSVEYQLDNVYSIKDRKKVKDLLCMQGLHVSNFDFIGQIENTINSNLNDVSIDDNSNKVEKTIEAIHQEVFASAKKAIGFDMLYRQMKEMYGKEEAKRLTGLMYDYTLAISDSTHLLKPYCWAADASKIVTLGRDFGQLQSKPCKRVSSYISALCETIHQMSSHLAGAIAIGTFFMDITHILLYKEGIDRNSFHTSSMHKKYVENEIQQFVHSVNHLSRNSSECVTEDTQVLTPIGFKGIDDLAIGDDIYTWASGKLIVSKVDRVNISNYSGEMHRYIGRDIIQEVTPNHRVFRKIYNTDNYELVDSAVLMNHKTNTTIPVAFSDIDFPDYDISDDLLKLSTIIMCDGSLHNNQIHIYKAPHKKTIKMIEDTLENCGIAYKKTTKATSFKNALTVDDFEKYPKEYEVCSYEINSKSLCDLLGGNKKELPSFFEKLSKRQSNIVIDTWKMFDGHCEVNNYGKTKLQVDNHRIADQLQHLCVRAGKGSRIHERFIGTNKKATIYVNVFNRPNKDASKKEKFQYTGRVWCPTTKEGIVVFRKNGIVFISGNSPFSNVSIFDKPKLKGLLSADNMGWYFDKPSLLSMTNEEWIDYVVDYIMEIQKVFIEFMDKGDPTRDGLPYRFPVVTINFSKQDGNIVDIELLDYITSKDIYRYNIFTSHGTRVASCCRLLTSNDMLDHASSSNSFGGSAISLGSHRVITTNFNRHAIMATSYEDFNNKIIKQVQDSVKVLNAHRELLKLTANKGMQQFITNGWINMNRLFSTFGIIGAYEANQTLIERFGKQSDDYIRDMLMLFNTEVLRVGKEHKIPVNLEQIPAESMAVRLCKADKLFFGEDKVPYTLYSNQFIPLWEDATIWERLEMDGKYNQLLTGGGIVHAQIGERVTQAQAKKIIAFAVKAGCEHFALNAVYSQCENNHATFGKNTICPNCSGKIVNYMTRVVGFLTPVNNWNPTRRDWEFDKRTFINI